MQRGFYFTPDFRASHVSACLSPSVTGVSGTQARPNTTCLEAEPGGSGAGCGGALPAGASWRGCNGAECSPGPWPPIPLPVSLKIHPFCEKGALCSMVCSLQDGSSAAPWEKHPSAVPLCTGGLWAEFILGGCLECGIYSFLKWRETLCCAEVESASPKCETWVGAHPCQCSVSPGRAFWTSWGSIPQGE